MIKRIARKEFVEMSRDGRFRWSAAVLLVLLSASLLTGWRSYASFSAQRGEAERSQREQWLGKNVANAHVAAHAGTTVYRPYLPLFAVDKGMDAYLGTSVFLEAHRRNPFQHAPAEYDARLQRFGEATAAAGYGAFWFGLAVCVNAFGRSAAGNALWLAGCWIMFVALIPPLVNLTVQTLRPLPASLSYADLERAANLKFNAEADQVGFEIRDAVNSAHQVISGDSASQARRDRAYYDAVARIPVGGGLLAEYLKRHPEWPQPATPGQLNYAVEEARREAIERRLAGVIERMNAERERRQSLMDGLAFFSPAILFQNLVDEITGASRARHRRFPAQLDSYVRTRDALFTSKIIRRENVRAADIDQIPRFEYREESFLQVVERAAINLIGLILPASLIIWYVSRALRRFSAIV